jgi:starvation-inducible DNA-binding protein
MSSAHKLKKEIQTVPLTDTLNRLLANAIDFRMLAKQAHWNARGENFIALHEMFDKISTDVDEYADKVAERVAQLGGTARGDLQTVSCQSSLFDYPLDMHDGREYLKLLDAALSILAETSRQAISRAVAVDDAVTADILTGVTRGLDKIHWYIRSHIV